jgi:hypothetical protein
LREKNKKVFQRIHTYEKQNYHYAFTITRKEDYSNINSHNIIPPNVNKKKSHKRKKKNDGSKVKKKASKSLLSIC